jgi:hypothetical protein
MGKCAVFPVELVIKSPKSPPFLEVLPSTRLPSKIEERFNPFDRTSHSPLEFDWAYKDHFIYPVKLVI